MKFLHVDTDARVTCSVTCLFSHLFPQFIASQGREVSKGKVHPRRGHEGAWGVVEVQFYSFFNLGARWGRRVVIATPWLLYLWERDTVPSYRRLGGPQGRSGWVRKITQPQGFDPLTVQPVASRYIDYEIPALWQCWLPNCGLSSCIDTCNCRSLSQDLLQMNTEIPSPFPQKIVYSINMVLTPITPWGWLFFCRKKDVIYKNYLLRSMEKC